MKESKIASIADNTTEVGNAWQTTVRKLTKANGMLPEVVHANLHKDPNLLIKSARWMPILLNEEMKVRVRTCKAFMVMIATAPSPFWTFSLWVSRQKVKRELAGFTLTQGGSKKELEGG